MRHGETEFNQLLKIQGWMDSPLTESGLEVAHLAGLGLREIQFDTAYSSDLLRAKRTAEIILKQNNYKETSLTALSDLREVSFGDFGGKERSTFRTACSKVLYGKENLALLDEQMLANEVTMKDLINIGYSLDKSGEAENYSVFVNRIVEAFKEMFKKAKQEGHEKILVVGHGLAIFAFIKEFAPEKVNVIGDIQNASVTRLRLMDKSILLVEDVASMDYVKRGKVTINN